MLAGVALLLLIVAFGALVYLQAFYEVSEDQAVVITEFGRPVGDPLTAPGRYLKKPFVQKANYFDTSLQDLEGEPGEWLTRDKVLVQVIAVTRWRIADPIRFLQRVRTRRSAEMRLAGVVDGEIREALGRLGHAEWVDDPIAIAGEVLVNARQRMNEMGVEVVDLELR